MLFQVGLPALDAFPRKLWTQIVVRVARQLDHEQMINPNLHCGMGYEPLPAETLEVLSFASALSRPSLAIVGAVLDVDPLPLLEPAIDGDVAGVEGGIIRFAHPLFAAAVYSLAASARSEIIPDM